QLEHEVVWCSTFSCLETPQMGDSAGFQDSYKSTVSVTAVAPFRCLAAMLPEGSARAGILPGYPSLDRGSRDAKVGLEPRTFRSVNSRSGLRQSWNISISLITDTGILKFSVLHRLLKILRQPTCFALLGSHQAGAVQVGPFGCLETSQTGDSAGFQVSLSQNQIDLQIRVFIEISPIWAEV
ncbi:hypothetical protein CSKR_110603, partial [Clonorchis sinensis]